MSYFPFVTVFTLVSALFLTTVHGDDHGVTFLYPSSTSITLNYLDTVNVTYLSTFSTPKLLTFCHNNTDPSILLQKEVANVPAFNSSQVVQLRWPDLSSCYFDLRPNSSAGYGANSFTIEINNTARATPMTFGLNQPAATSPSSSPTTTTSLSPTSTPSNSNPGRSRAMDIGVGVGVGAIGIALIGAALFFYRRRKSEKARRGAAIPDHDSTNEVEGQTNDQKLAWQNQAQELGQNVPLQPINVESHEMSSPGQGTHMLPEYQNAHEMPAQTAYEMSADTRAHEINPESSIDGAAPPQDNKQNRFSWEDRAGSRV